MTSSICIHILFSLMTLVLLTRSDPILVTAFTGEQEDTCSIYPLCSEHGEGSHEILEDCRRYIECESGNDGQYTQRNMMCEDNLVFTNQLGRCGDPNEASECKQFENLKCKQECPRIFFSSSGFSSSTQAEAMGCFRLKGSKDLNRAAYYENSNKLTLTPYPNNIWISWFVTTNPKCPYSGRLVNEQEKYLQCPRTDWAGWDVKTGEGMIKDESIVTRCLSGDEQIQPSTSTTATTTLATTTVTTMTTTTTYTTTRLTTTTSVITATTTTTTSATTSTTATTALAKTTITTKPITTTTYTTPSSTTTTSVTTATTTTTTFTTKVTTSNTTTSIKMDKGIN